ncbi:hypothetical protein ScPMuIL_017518 [Solemya velum]
MEPIDHTNVLDFMVSESQRLQGSERLNSDVIENMFYQQRTPHNGANTLALLNELFPAKLHYPCKHYYHNMFACVERVLGEGLSKKVPYRAS